MLLLTAPLHVAARAGSLLSPTRLALGRTGIGVVMVANPTLMPSTLGVDDASAERMGWVVQMLGAREIALGLGALASSRAGDRRGARLWLMAGVLSDTIDALAVARAVGAGRLSQPLGGAVVATAAGAAAIGARGLARR